MPGSFIMRKILLSLVMILSANVAHANALCGAEIDIADEALKAQIDASAAATANSSLVNGELKQRVIKDQDGFGFQNIASSVNIDVIAAYYFRSSCLSLLKSKPAPTKENLEKLTLIASGLNNPASATNVLKSISDAVVENKAIVADKPVEENKVSPEAIKGFQQALEVDPKKEKLAKARKFRGFDPNGGKKTRGFDVASAKAIGGCKEIGEIGGCSNLEDVINSLKEADLKYNHPDSMYLGRKTQISLILETTGEDQSSELKGLNGQIKEGKSKVSRIMQAELSGASFKIEPSGPQKKTITSLAPVKWTWFVTPLEDGQQKRLNLELAAILREATRDLPPVTIRTFKTEINVDVKWWDLALHKIKSLDPIYQLATAIGGIASALLLLWRFVSWGRRRKG